MAVSRNQKQTNARKRARPAGRGANRTERPRRRWLVVPLALGVAALALYVLASGARLDFLEPGEPPMDEIGDASRLRLEAVLSEGDSAARGTP